MKKKKKEQLSLPGLEEIKKLKVRKPSLNQQSVIELRRIADALELLTSCAEDVLEVLENPKRSS